LKWLVTFTTGLACDTAQPVIDFWRLLLYMFVQNFIELNAAVFRLCSVCVDSENKLSIDAENNTTVVSQAVKMEKDR